MLFRSSVFSKRGADSEGHSQFLMGLPTEVDGESSFASIERATDCVL